ncbi:MAG TPA: PRC-barrel domain protein, partial [Euryarchaeota archaeon]|nr:PRC-barrel domain protein [Euryarchaeota archaeon]
MKKFASELRGKTVMTNNGRILGIIENFVMDTITGDLKHVLVIPDDTVEVKLYDTDSKGRLVLPFEQMEA